MIMYDYIYIMIYDDIWLYTMIYDDIVWYVMICDDIRYLNVLNCPWPFPWLPNVSILGFSVAFWASNIALSEIWLGQPRINLGMGRNSHPRKHAFHIIHIYIYIIIYIYIYVNNIIYMWLYICDYIYMWFYIYAWLYIYIWLRLPPSFFCMARWPVLGQRVSKVLLGTPGISMPCNAVKGKCRMDPIKSFHLQIFYPSPRSITECRGRQRSKLLG